MNKDSNKYRKEFYIMGDIYRLNNSLRSLSKDKFSEFFKKKITDRYNKMSLKGQFIGTCINGDDLVIFVEESDIPHTTTIEKYFMYGTLEKLWDIWLNKDFDDSESNDCK